MHFLIGLGILAGLVWFAFGAGAARAVVGAVLALPVLAILVFITGEATRGGPDDVPFGKLGHRVQVEQQPVAVRTAPRSDDDYAKRTDKERFRERDDQMVLDAAARGLDAARTDKERAMMEYYLARAASEAMDSAVAGVSWAAAVQSMCRAKHIANCTNDAAVAWKKRISDGE
jgi:hypothetical protein